MRGRGVGWRRALASAARRSAFIARTRPSSQPSRLAHGRRSVFNTHGKRAAFPFAATAIGELVYVPASEADRLSLDCRRSRLGRPRLWDYLGVQARTADVERLVREAGGNQEAAAETQAQAVSSNEGAAAPDAQEAGTKPQVPAVSDAREADTRAQAVAPGAANAGNFSPAEMGRAGGKKSSEKRRAGLKWVPPATELAKAECSREPWASHARIARLIAPGLALLKVAYPEPRWLSEFVSKRRASGELPKKSGKPRK